MLVPFRTLIPGERESVVRRRAMLNARHLRVVTRGFAKHALPDSEGLWRFSAREGAPKETLPKALKLPKAVGTTTGRTLAAGPRRNIVQSRLERLEKRNLKPLAKARPPQGRATAQQAAARCSTAQQAAASCHEPEEDEDEDEDEGEGMYFGHGGYIGHQGDGVMPMCDPSSPSYNDW
ncbi:hypothetical protein M885DRAFT_255785 [Pelagophyceae sp. CCMP2097]|nr:hypothetical protein M885DRAFT_255785 [Pelagophyceae sp. CCMP2097]